MSQSRFPKKSFDPALLPDAVRSQEFGVNLLNGVMLQEYCSDIHAGDFQRAFKAHLQTAANEARDLRGEENKDSFFNLCAWMVKHGFVLLQTIIPVLKRRGKMSVALNMLDDYHDLCWCFESKNSDVVVLRRLFDSAFQECLIEKDSSMVADLQLAHKGEFKRQKYERLLRALEADFEGYRFDLFFPEFAKHVARKPEDLDLLLDLEDEALSSFVIARTIEFLQKLGKQEVVDAILKKPRNFGLYKMKMAEVA